MRLNDEFVESGTGKEHAVFCLLLNPGDCIIRFQNILFADFPKTFRPYRGEINCCHQRAERLIRTDIRCRLFTPDVLFARGQREHKTAPAGKILSHSHEAARHLADVSFSRREKPDVRPAKAWRHAERLSFTDDYIRSSAF